MLRLAQPSTRRRPPPGGSTNGSRRPRRPRWSEGWEVRALLAGGLYFAAAEFAPFDRVDAWIDERFFWEPIGLAAIALLLALAIIGRQAAAKLGANSPDGVPSELVPICVRCKAVHEKNDCWEPIEAYLAHRTPDKFARSLCPDCLERLAS